MEELEILASELAYEVVVSEFKQKIRFNMNFICDVIWENLPHVAQGNFAEINKIILELLCFSLFLINFDNT